MTSPAVQTTIVAQERFIYESKNQLDIPSVFAGLLSVILIGLLVENYDLP